MFYALTGSLPKEAPERLNDQRLLISKEVPENLPPFAVTAIANALQVKQETRTASFERFKAELSSAPSVVTEIEHTDAIRRLPPIDMDCLESGAARGLADRFPCHHTGSSCDCSVNLAETGECPLMTFKDCSKQQRGQ